MTEHLLNVAGVFSCGGGKKPIKIASFLLVCARIVHTEPYKTSNKIAKAKFRNLTPKSIQKGLGFPFYHCRGAHSPRCTNYQDVALKSPTEVLKVLLDHSAIWADRILVHHLNWGGGGSTPTGTPLPQWTDLQKNPHEKRRDTDLTL